MLDDPRKGTAVAALGSGGVMVILTYILFVLHADVPAPVVAAITGLLGSIAGVWVHSTTIQEDRAALHRVILARLDEHAAPQPYPARFVSTLIRGEPGSRANAAPSPPRTSPMGDVRP